MACIGFETSTCGLQAQCSNHQESQQLPIFSQLLLPPIVCFIFFSNISFILGAIALEYWRQTANTAKKEKKQDDNLVLLRKELNRLTETVESRQQVIDELTKALENYQSTDFKLVKTDPNQQVQKLKPKS